MAAKGSRRLEKAKMARHNEAMIALYEPSRIFPKVVVWLENSVSRTFL